MAYELPNYRVVRESEARRKPIRSACAVSWDMELIMHIMDLNRAIPALAAGLIASFSVADSHAAFIMFTQ